MNLYGFYIGTEQGMKHHYYSVQTVSKGTKEIEREFVAAIDVSESEFIWFAESCLFGTVLFKIEFPKSYYKLLSLDCRRSLQRCSMCLRIPLATLVERASNDRLFLVHALFLFFPYASIFLQCGRRNKSN